MIGGCCGTMPEHVHAMAQALEGREIVTHKKVVPVEVRVPARPAPSARPARPVPAPPSVEPSIVDLVKERVAVIVELDPPRDLDHGPIVRGANA